jgi:hypothetical protein
MSVFSNRRVNFEIMMACEMPDMALKRSSQEAVYGLEASNPPGGLRMVCLT